MRDAARYVALIVLTGGALVVGAGTAGAAPPPGEEQQPAAAKADETLTLLDRLLAEASAAGTRQSTNAGER